MAYLDHNNDQLYPQGDPLENLDKELADLREALGNMETNASDPPQASDSAPEEPSEPVSADPPSPIPQAVVRRIAADTAAPDTPDPQTLIKAEEDMKQNSTKKAAHAAKDPEGKRRVPLILAAIILSVAVIIGVGYAALRFLLPHADTPVAVSNGEMVTISDSVMGDIELQTVKGAEINTYTAENLVTDENGIPAYYENGKKISHLGVDLSEFQGNVDFSAMKNAGVEFVMLRVGGRYYSDEGKLYEDKLFEANYEAAKAAGLKIGAYFFSQANCAEDAKEEAEFALNILNGRQLSYPVALDWENIAEDVARTDNVYGDALTSIAETFCDTVNAAGYRSIVYSNTQQMFVMYDFETMKDYDFWLADYREFPTMYYKFDMWQYTKDGQIDGVEGTVDLNLSFTDFTD